jgi:polyhydroxyalkanoate synthesis regulator phasin
MLYLPQPHLFQTMAINDFVQKAVFLGLGVASYAGEKVSETLNDLPGLSEQMRKAVDEMVSKGEMSAEEARKAVDELMRRAQTGDFNQNTPPSDVPKPQPRNIEISDETDPIPPESAVTKTTSSDNIDVDAMRRQVQDLQDELRRLRKN